MQISFQASGARDDWSVRNLGNRDSLYDHIINGVHRRQTWSSVTVFCQWNMWAEWKGQGRKGRITLSILIYVDTLEVEYCIIWGNEPKVNTAVNLHRKISKRLSLYSIVLWLNTVLIHGTVKTSKLYMNYYCTTEWDEGTVVTKRETLDKGLPVYPTNHPSTNQPRPPPIHTTLQFVFYWHDHRVNIARSSLQYKQAESEWEECCGRLYTMEMTTLTHDQRQCHATSYCTKLLFTDLLRRVRWRWANERRLRIPTSCPKKQNIGLLFYKPPVLWHTLEEFAASDSHISTTKHCPPK